MSALFHRRQDDAPALPEAPAESPLAGHDAVLADLDGVVYRGPNPVPGAIDALNAAQALGFTIAYLTNNASRPARTVAEHLTELGLSVAERDVVTSPQAAVPMLFEELEPGDEVLVVGGPGLLEEVEAAGFAITRTATEQTKAVVQGFAKDVQWSDLAEAAYAVAAGAAWIGTNQDWTLPNERGLAPGNGTLLSAVHTATGTFPKIAGKPERPIYDVAITRFKTRNPLFIGDRLDTDIQGARTVGIESALVLTGVDGAAELLKAEESQRPDYILASLADLHRPYPLLEIAPNGAVVGDAAVIIAGSDVIIDRGDPRDVNTLRAATAAVWTSETPASALRMPEELVGRLG